ncbi:MAG TPA: hypothetical protein VGB53_02660 [Rubricoccaceae bacterium]|jgi:hypothetical protein
MRLALAALAMLLAAPLVQAQSVADDPTYGSVELDSGFVPDPYEMPLMAGGSTEVSVSGCTGTVAEAPDLNLTWGGGSTLYIYATSDTDTTLLVNLPNGEWSCDDDTIGTNPLVIVTDAPAGLYNIWSGTYGGGTAEATVMISEIDPR